MGDMSFKPPHVGSRVGDSRLALCAISPVLHTHKKSFKGGKKEKIKRIGKLLDVKRSL